MANEVDHAEIIRLRDRVHAIANTVQGLAGKVERIDSRLESLDQDIRAHVLEYEAKVDALILSEELAKAVQALSERRWTFRQKLVATVVGVVAAGCTVSTTVVVVLQASH